MVLLSKDDEIAGYTPRTWPFWRNLAVYFCVFSIVGHWLEIVYCSFVDFFFGIIEDDFLVWDDPMYPFLIYGIGAIVCSLLLVPLKIHLIENRKTLRGAAILFFIITVFVCMSMELAMGFTLNRPDEFGEYPLWDNSTLPLNILGQAWLVNDLVLGIVAMLYTWIIYPMSEKWIKKVPPPIMNASAFTIVAGFILLCVLKFS